MKKEYNRATLEVIYFENEDIITTSDNGGDNDVDTGTDSWG